MNKLDITKVIKKLNDRKISLPNELADIAQSAFINNFRTSSFFGEPWANVERRKKPAPKSDKQANKRGILRGKTRHLFHSVEKLVREVSWDEIKLSTSRDVVSKNGFHYAQIHNEGGGNIPKRQFMGDHPKLREKIKKHIFNRIKEIFP